LNGRDLDAILVADRGAELGVDDVAPIGSDLRLAAHDVGAPEDDAVVGRRRVQRHGDARAGVQANARAADGVLEGFLEHELNHGDSSPVAKKKLWEWVVSPPPRALKSLIVTECYVINARILCGFVNPSFTLVQDAVSWPDGAGTPGCRGGRRRPCR